MTKYWATKPNGAQLDIYVCWSCHHVLSAFAAMTIKHHERLFAVVG